jgi:transposase
MPKPCSLDLRMRVLREVEAGASRREAADCVEVSASSAIKWMQRLNETGSIAAKPSGGSISPLEAHAAVLLGLIAEQPDLTLDEIVAVGSPAAAARRGGSSSGITSASKKACAQRSSSERM